VARPRRATLPAVLLLGVSALPLRAADPSLAVGEVEVMAGAADTWDGRAWKALPARSRFATGQRVRTRADGVARVDFAFTAVVVSPGSVFGLAPSRVLTSVLDQGRVELLAEDAIIKLRTAEATVRGRGRVAVRRDGESTRVSVLAGRFQVQAGTAGVRLDAGQGTWVEKGRPPAPATPLPAAPLGLAPGADPVYLQRGAPVRLSWWPTVAAHRIEVWEAAAGQLIVDREVGGAPADVDLPNPGTYRWRVYTRDEHGLESLPSADGFVCIVDR
jgi:hypothetical protein